LVLPGDELIMECAYDTKARKEMTFGGLSTREEMCMGFITYYPRAPLADCRSLPTLTTALAALGVRRVRGQAIEHLERFLRDIDVDRGEETFRELLSALAEETGRREFSLLASISPSRSPQLPRPLTEEDLLSRPFYTVNVQNPTPQVQVKDYRTLILEMMLSLKIEEPERLSNVTVGQHLAGLNWPNPALAVERQLAVGMHNGLCLAHGRKALMPYSEFPFPKVIPWTSSGGKCGGRVTKQIVGQNELQRPKWWKRPRRLRRPKKPKKPRMKFSEEEKANLSDAATEQKISLVSYFLIFLVVKLH